MLAGRGLDVVGLDPAAGSLARAVAVDVVVMTGDTAQAITGRAEWTVTLRAAHDALLPGGHLVLETRDPAAQAWEGWTEEATARTQHAPGVGQVRTRVQVTSVEGPLVPFTTTSAFASDGQELVSQSLLRFRGRAQVEADLAGVGFTVVDVRDAPDRPRHELVVVAARGPE